MNDYIDTREGWVRYEIEGATPIRDEEHVVMEYRDHQAVAYWLPKAPVPPLPTATWSVIRVTWRENAQRLSDDELVLHEEGWRDTANRAMTAAELVGRITGFEVLAEPVSPTDHEVFEDIRRETVKAALDRVRQTGIWQVVLLANPKNGDELDAIARDFGVES